MFYNRTHTHGSLCRLSGPSPNAIRAQSEDRVVHSDRHAATKRSFPTAAPDFLEDETQKGNSWYKTLALFTRRQNEIEHKQVPMQTSQLVIFPTSLAPRDSVPFRGRKGRLLWKRGSGNTLAADTSSWKFSETTTHSGDTSSSRIPLGLQ